jgi:hypothetical protein
MKMNANRVWGLARIFAYNLMRYSSFEIKRNGCFLQTTRRKLVLIAGEVIVRSRSIEIKIMDFILREVNRIEKVMYDQKLDASRCGAEDVLQT